MAVVEVQGPITKIEPKKNDFKIIHIRVNKKLKDLLNLDVRTKQISIVGDIKNVCVGEVFSGYVEEIRHQIYGRQFRIRGRYTTSPPEFIEDSKALVGYMSDKFADGIGIELAEDLLDVFGQNIIKELEIISRNAISIVKESALKYGIEDLSLLTRKHNKKLNIFDDDYDEQKKEIANNQQIVKYMCGDLKKNSCFCEIVNDLLKIPNIGLQRIVNIIIGWELDRNKRESFIYFSTLGFTNYQIEEILDCCEKSGINNPISYVQENTIYAMYDIGAELPFTVVDDAAVKMSIWKDDPKRVEYVLRFCVKEKTNDGHTCYPVEDIKLEATKRCSISAIESWLETNAIKSIDSVFEDGAALPAVIYDCSETSSVNPKERMLYTNFMFSCECYSAKAINMLLSKPVNYLHDIVQEEIIKPYEDETHIKLDDSQISALMLSANSRISVLTGGPGTGKTTIMKALAGWLKNVQKRPVVLCAPTGKAARRLQSATGIQSYTIHRALGLKIPVLSTKVLKRINKGDFILGDEESCWDDSTIIIDESSMMDMHLATLVLCKASVSSNAQILFVGDVDQLPSVGPGIVLHSLISSGKIPVSRLQIVHRQKDGGIVEAAKIIRELPSDIIMDSMPGIPFTNRLQIKNELSGEMFFINHEMLRHMYKLKEYSPFEDAVRNALYTFYTTDYLETYFNAKKEDVQILVPMRNKPCGIISLNFYLQRLYNKTAATYLNCKEEKTERELNTVSVLDISAFGKMKKETDFFIDEDYGSQKEKEEHPWRWFVGDKAMCIKNDYKNEVYNGELGTVIDLDARAKIVTIEYPDISVVCNYGYKEDKDKGIMPLSHLQPAYVSTIHKSQGSEYPVVILIIAKENTIMLKRRLIYTAITRAKNVCIVLFENEALERSLQNYMDQPRMTNLAEKICLLPESIYKDEVANMNDMPLF